MNRRRIRLRIFLRELSFWSGSIGAVIIALDWLNFPLLLPHTPAYVRILAIVCGAAMFWASVVFDKCNRRWSLNGDLMLDKESP